MLSVAYCYQCPANNGSKATLKAPCDLIIQSGTPKPGGHDILPYEYASLSYQALVLIYMYR